MASGKYCALSFSQMQETSGFLMEIKNVKRPYILQSFLSFVTIQTKACRHLCEGCDRKITIAFDCFYRLVIMKALRDYVEGCSQRNKEIGYRSYKNIAVNNHKHRS